MIERTERPQKRKAAITLALNGRDGWRYVVYIPPNTPFVAHSVIRVESGVEYREVTVRMPGMEPVTIPLSQSDGEELMHMLEWARIEGE